MYSCVCFTGWSVFHSHAHTAEERLSTSSCIDRRRPLWLHEVTTKTGFTATKLYWNTEQRQSEGLAAVWGQTLRLFIVLNTEPLLLKTVSELHVFYCLDAVYFQSSAFKCRLLLMWLLFYIRSFYLLSFCLSVVDFLWREVLRFQTYS